MTPTLPTSRTRTPRWRGRALAAPLALVAAALLLLSCQTPGGRLAEAPGYPQSPDAATSLGDPLDPQADLDAPSRGALLASLEGPTPAINLTPQVLAALDPEQRFATGLDQMVRLEFEPLHFRNTLVVTSRLALDSEGRHLLETLLADRRPVVSRVVLFDDELPAPARSPRVDRALAGSPATRLFIRTPAAPALNDSMFGDAEVVLIDLPLRPGAFQPEANFLAGVLEAAFLRDLRVIVLDRPTAFRALDGPVGPVDASIHSYFPVPAFHGLTTGELARFHNQFLGVDDALEVKAATRWQPSEGLGPFLRALDAAGADPASELEEWPDYFGPDPERIQAAALQSLLPEPLRARSRVEGTALLIDGVDADRACAALQPSGLACEPRDGGIALVASDLSHPARDAAFLLAALLEQEPAAFEGGHAAAVGAGLAPERLQRAGGAAGYASRWASAPAWQGLAERRNRILLYR